jgi:hypothetical protein
MTAADPMSTGVVPPPSCGAVRKGKPCGLPRGWGTDHVGWGHCKFHGGASPGGRKAALREAAAAMMRADVVEVDITPVDGQLYPVRRAAALAMYYRTRLAQMEEATSGWVWWSDREREALADLARWSKLALDAGVAERAVRFAERTGQRISIAFDEAVEPLDLPPAERAGLVERFAHRLTLLEQTADDDVMDAPT